MNPNENQIVVYQPNETVRMDGRLRMRRCGEDEWYDKVTFVAGRFGDLEIRRNI
jgi:hypothetical protein